MAKSRVVILEDVGDVMTGEKGQVVRRGGRENAFTEVVIGEDAGRRR